LGFGNALFEDFLFAEKAGFELGPLEGLNSLDCDPR
jgi:hypothetical protein